MSKNALSTSTIDSTPSIPLYVEVNRAEQLGLLLSDIGFVYSDAESSSSNSVLSGMVWVGGLASLS